MEIAFFSILYMALLWCPRAGSTVPPPSSPPIIVDLTTLCSTLPGEDEPSSSLQIRYVQLRGFWHPISSESGMLSPRPGLKSCCLLSPVTPAKGVVVRGEIASISPSKAVTLEGFLSLQTLYDERRQKIQCYVLERAREVHLPSSDERTWIVAGLLMAALGGWIIFFLQTT